MTVLKFLIGFLFVAATLASGCGVEGDSGDSYCSVNPVESAGSFCASVQMPDEMVGTPEKVSFHFFDSLPPMGPPSLMGLELATPTELAPFVAGAEVPVLIENMPDTGALHVYIAVYMPGGGATTWMVVPGVDYAGGHSAEDELLEFTGEPINLTEPFVLSLVQ